MNRRITISVFSEKVWIFTVFTVFYCLFQVSDVANEGEASAQHGARHSHEAVVPTIPKRLGQESQAYGTEIPSVWDRNPKRMGQESQAYETEIPSVWD